MTMTAAMPGISQLDRVLQTYQLEDVGWPVNASPVGFHLSEDVVAKGAAIISQAAQASTREPTAVWNIWGVPSLLARLDFTFTGPAGEEVVLGHPRTNSFAAIDGPLGIYEVEFRPAGFGVSCALDPTFRRRLRDVLGAWPFDFRVVIDPSRKHDEHAWISLNRITLGPDVPDDGSFVIVRAEPWQHEYDQLAPRSLSLLTTKGDRSYGEKLGLWRRITSVDELPESGTFPFVVKPLASSKGRGIIGIKHRSNFKVQGFVSRQRGLELTTALLAQDGACYVQQYLPGMRLESGGNPTFMALRSFYLYNLRTKQWECIGGFWNLRPHFVVHGASNTVFGPLTLA